MKTIDRFLRNAARGDTMTPRLGTIATKAEFLNEQAVDDYYVQQLMSQYKQTDYAKVSQPVLVVDFGNDRYYILDGQHRIAGAQMAGLHIIPAYIIAKKDFDAVLAKHFKSKIPDEYMELDQFIQMPPDAYSGMYPAKYEGLRD